MEKENLRLDTDVVYPILFIPKKCTALETNSDMSDNVYIDLTITSPDTEGNETCIYSGFCNVKLVESCDVNLQRIQSPNGSSSADTDIDQVPLILTEANQMSFPGYNQSRVWIDPSRSPYVYNHYDTAQAQYAKCDTRNCITVEQHNTYITQNVYNYKESNVYSCKDYYQSGEFEHKKFRKAEAVVSSHQEPNLNYYEEDEFECGVFLSQLPEEIMNEKKSKKDQRQVVQDENNALKQLMSSDIQSVSKQRKTILFLGQNSDSGHTIQNISYNDPLLRCASIEECTDDIFEEPSDPKKKRYQCDKCKQIFRQLAGFRQHLAGAAAAGGAPDAALTYLCRECGRNLKNFRKFEIHCIGHGDPDLECDKCHKVFATKFTLRAHQKIHNRKHPCAECSKSFTSIPELKIHMKKLHNTLICDQDECFFTTSNLSEIEEHKSVHSIEKWSSDTDFAVTYEEEKDESQDMKVEQVIEDEGDRIRKADSVIAKVISNKIFLLNSKKAKKHKFNKTCGVCLKKFDRIGDLKRHLIEHVIRSTLAKTPVSKNGTLNIICEVCNTDTFTRVDKYKAHLREHAKLTLYKCTFCDKSFSDSSNFSKHKKIHGISYFQCDLCQRKFNSKKMIAQHMEYHNKNSPIKCKYCGKIFHFESMLNKHIKCTHTKQSSSKFRCRFCDVFFKSLKEKWDHEWEVHSVRKLIVDCLVCGYKFRKYSELKRHCSDEHDMEIPPARSLTKKRRFF